MALKKRLKLILGIIVALATILIYSCQPESFLSQEVILDLPATPYVYNVGDNDHLPTLGRVLFYDPRLSTNNSVSCSSCHKQELAFADRADFSLGFENKLTDRNSMPIQNIVAHTFFGNNGNGEIDSLGLVDIVVEPKPGNDVIDPGFGPIFGFQPTALFWDGRQHSLQTMVMEPIKNHIEMGTTNFENLAAKLSQIPEYRVLFANAFEDGAVNPEHIAEALSAFLVSIRSDQSKFDLSLRGQAQLSGLEQFGRDLFFDTYDCNSCHNLDRPFNGYQAAGPGLFGGFSNIGLEEKPSDPGLRQVTGNPADEGKFKIPSLRNIALTAPYMHDGQLATLEDVLDHYSENIKNTKNLDPRLQSADGSAKQFHIPDHEKRAIIAFLNSMTDYQMISDRRFSNPFRTK